MFSTWESKKSTRASFVSSFEELRVNRLENHDNGDVFIKMA